VIFMSGYAEQVLASEGRLPPDVLFLQKPFAASAVVARALADRTP